MDHPSSLTTGNDEVEVTFEGPPAYTHAKSSHPTRSVSVLSSVSDLEESDSGGATADSRAFADQWREYRTYRLVGAFLLLLLCGITVVDIAIASEEYTSTALPPAILLFVVLAAALSPTLKFWSKTVTAPAARRIPVLGAVALFAFQTLFVAVKRGLVCAHNITLCPREMTKVNAAPTYIIFLVTMAPHTMTLPFCLSPRSLCVAQILAMVPMGYAWFQINEPREAFSMLLGVGINTLFAVGLYSKIAKHRLAEFKAKGDLVQSEAVAEHAQKARSRIRVRFLEQVDRRRKIRSQAKAQERLMGFVCHELRAPLHALTGTLDTLIETLEEEHGDDNPYADDLETMAASSEQMSLIINDVLASASLHGQKTGMRIQPTWSDINLIVKHCRLFIESYVQVPVMVTAGQEVPKLVWLDPLRVKQVLLNGLSNAAKLTTTGQIEIIITMVNPAVLKVTVVDTGPGLVDVTEEELFQPFVQGAVPENAQSAFEKGTGLGLSVCRDLMTSMDGELHLENRGDGVRGASFWFQVVCVPSEKFPDPNATTLSPCRSLARAASMRRGTPHMYGTQRSNSFIGSTPRHSAGPSHGDEAKSERPVSDVRSNESAELSVNTRPRPGKRAIAGSPLPTDGKFILAIDDDRGSRKLMGRMLQKLGFEHHLEADGDNAVQLLTNARAAGKTCIVLCDVYLLAGSGEDVCRDIHSAMPEVPVVATTGTTNAGDLHRLVEVTGFNTVLSKPFTRQALADVVRRMLAAPEAK